MSDRTTALTDDERALIIATLVNAQARLDRAGELLAAVHIAHALECLDPENPINRQTARKVH